ncbi:tRNA guanosine(34) transglycosylase Tgt [Phycisphaera mikurensis]|uniref:Queuine tRNA-ribosyltransferase n=1 Tax=Phycisphaera mikurensis (strain NBRC 102666 / KCTC 22515 / FYK2301M01) TaxID=1142394 RepID=I0IGY6_PHYMF|nr:tRNA guanosine(34) transglycosylase Tgt [Phycisphaera mikurensis]MBB6440781.1 queuine tRNA-ribosyltransferase [Phycisphaera mikurensis]BAM04524.1 queuine tRNA-ribosyltransferase [Phycisphaera mikurensis NBRC 102666]
MKFELHHASGPAGPRTGTVHTPHGSFPTPAFMTVGTQGTVKGVTPEQVRATGAGILLGNTYHLLLRPGPELLERAGGLHRFMRWDGPILTDSGGFQVFSLGHINRIGEDGVVFKNPLNGDLVDLTPERSIATQHAIGGDILMAFDDCPPAGGDDPAAARERSKLAMERTHRWLDRCVAFHRGRGRDGRQALFGIVQGGTDEGDRAACVEAVCSHDLPGYAIGGVAVGEDTAAIDRIVAHTAPLMPADKPRYLMGVGYPRDIVAAVRSGVDLFDCVLPTRHGRSGHAFTAAGALKLKNAPFREDFAVLEDACDCPACVGGYTRAYLHHLVKCGEILGGVLLTLHNLRLYQRLMADLRATIPGGRWDAFFSRWPCAIGPEEGQAADERR